LPLDKRKQDCLFQKLDPIYTLSGGAPLLSRADVSYLIGWSFAGVRANIF